MSSTRSFPSSFIYRMFAVVLAAGIFSCQQDAAAQTSHPVVRPQKSVQMQDFMGVNVLFSFYDAVDYSKQIAALQQLGIKWVRLGLYWYWLEPQPGPRDYSKLDPIMDAIKAAGLNSVVYVVGPPAHQSLGAGTARPDQYPPADNGAYADLLVEMAERYPQVNAWQIWNEPNSRAFWQPTDQPAAYDALVKTVAGKMRQAVPDRTLVLAGMAYWSYMFDLGRLMFQDLYYLHTYSVVDALAYHPYLKTPYGDPDPANPYNFITIGQWLDGVLNQWSGGKPIWATEWGWGSYQTVQPEEDMVSEPVQAKYILQRLALMMAMGYDKVFYFNIADLPDYVALPFRDSGLIRNDATPKPSYLALARFLQLAKGRLDPTDPPSMAGTQPPSLWQFSWKTGAGKKLWIVWSDLPVTVTLGNISAPVRINDLVAGTVTTANPVSGNVAISVSASPLVVELP